MLIKFNKSWGFLFLLALLMFSVSAIPGYAEYSTWYDNTSITSYSQRNWSNPENAINNNWSNSTYAEQSHTKNNIEENEFIINYTINNTNLIESGNVNVYFSVNYGSLNVFCQNKSNENWVFIGAIWEVNQAWRTENTSFIINSGCYNSNDDNITILFNTTNAYLPPDSGNIPNYARIYENVLNITYDEEVNITIHSPLNQTYNTNQVLLNFTLVDPDDASIKCWRNVDGENEIGLGYIPNNTQYTENISLSAGVNHNIEIKCFDTTTNQTEQIFFSLGNYTFDDCSANTIPIFNFSIMEEESNALENANLDVYMTFWEISSEYNFTYNATFSGSSEYAICVNSLNTTINMDGLLNYWNDTSNFYNRNYWFDNYEVDNSTDLIDLYLYNATSEVVFSVKDFTKNPYKDIIIKALRWFPGENLYKLVGMGKTRPDGQTAIELKTTNYTYYKFFLEQNNEILAVIDPMLIITSPVPFTIGVGYQPPFLEYWNNLGYSCQYNNITTTLICVYSDTSSKMVNMNLDVDKYTGLTETNICSDSSVSSSGSLSCNLGNTTGNIYLYRLYGGYPNDETYIFYQGELDFSTAVQYGLTGVFISLMIIFACGVIGLWNPGVSIITALAGLGISAWFGFLDISMAWIFGLVIAGIIILFKVST